MKKTLSIIASCLAIMAVVSCGNRNGKKTQTSEPVEKTSAQIQTEQIIKMQLDSLANKLSQVDPIGVIGSVKEGKIELTEKEKQVKPGYLVPTNIANDLQTLSQKYRAIAVLAVDTEIAKMYDMPVKEYNAALTKLYADVNDPALKTFSEELDIKESIDRYYTASKESNREYLFWEVMTASLTEQIYIVSQNTEKFITAFTDKSASDVTYDIVLLTIALEDLANLDPTYASLNETIAPLKKINAIDVNQLRSQLESIKDEIAVSHANLLK